MKYLDFEKHIKKEFEGSTETVQMDALLSSLNLGGEPRRRGFSYWKMTPFLLLAFAALAWFYIATPTAHNEQLATTQNKATTAENLMSDEGSNPEIMASNAIHSTENTNKKENTSKEKPLGNSNETLENTQTNIASTRGVELTANNAAARTNMSKRDETSLGLEGKDNVLSTNSPSMSTRDQVTPFLVNQRSETSHTNSSYIQPEGKTAEIEGIPAKPMAHVPTKDVKAARNLVSLAELDNSVSTLESAAMDDELFTRMKINCPSFSSESWHMALIPEIGVFMPNKTLENTSTDQSSAFEERMNSESTLEGIEVGLYGMLVRDNVPFYLKAGVSYSRITERMDLQYEYTLQDTTVGIIASTVSDNGDTITHIYGDIISETTYKGSNRQHYYMHLFDIPVSVGYTSYVAGLDVGFEAGVKVNFMTRATGNMLTSQSDYTNLSLNRMFKNRIGLSYFGGLMIGRNFGRFGDFYIAPRFTYYPNDFNNQNNSIRQRYFTIGLNAGVVYKIN